jgi:hypothetical protein
MTIVFASAKLRKEFTRLRHWNPPLCDILDKLDRYLHEHHQKALHVTCVLRSQEENDKIYAGEKPKKTAHGVWAAVDIRSHGLESHIPAMLEFLNAYTPRNANRTRNGKTAIFHEVKGHGPHFHIQFQERARKAHAKKHDVRT